MEQAKSRLSVLVVEDEEPLRRIIRSLLRERGHSVKDTGSPAEALKFASEQKFDVALVDVLLGDGDGFTFIRALSPKLPDARIVAMSGGGTHLNAGYLIRTAVSFGAHVSLAKPFSADELFAVVEHSA